MCESVGAEGGVCVCVRARSSLPDTALEQFMRPLHNMSSLWSYTVMFIEQANPRAGGRVETAAVAVPRRCDCHAWKQLLDECVGDGDWAFELELVGTRARSKPPRLRHCVW